MDLLDEGSNVGLKVCLLSTEVLEWESEEKREPLRKGGEPNRLEELKVGRRKGNHRDGKLGLRVTRLTTPIRNPCLQPFFLLFKSAMEESSWRKM